MKTQQTNKKKSVRGYYYDLTNSPYVVEGVSSDIKFLFPSEKKKEMFLKEYDKRLNRLEILLSRVCNISGQTYSISNNMKSYIMSDIYNGMKRNF